MGFINSRIIVSPLMIYLLGNPSEACKEIRPTYDSRGNSFDSCKTNYTHIKSKRKIFQKRKTDEQFIPWNTNPRKHIIHANRGAKTPGPTDLEWLQYAQHFSNFTMISLLIIMPNKIRQLKLFEKFHLEKVCPVKCDSYITWCLVIEFP